MTPNEFVYRYMALAERFKDSPEQISRTRFAVYSESDFERDKQELILEYQKNKEEEKLTVFQPTFMVDHPDIRVVNLIMDSNINYFDSSEIQSLLKTFLMKKKTSTSESFKTSFKK